MYRIQAYDKTRKNWIVKWATNMTERDQILNELATSGIPRAAISFEWLARKGY